MVRSTNIGDKDMASVNLVKKETLKSYLTTNGLKGKKVLAWYLAKNSDKSYRYLVVNDAVIMDCASDVDTNCPMVVMHYENLETGRSWCRLENELQIDTTKDVVEF